MAINVCIPFRQFLLMMMKKEHPAQEKKVYEGHLKRFWGAAGNNRCTMKVLHL